MRKATVIHRIAAFVLVELFCNVTFILTTPPNPYKGVLFVIFTAIIAYLCSIGAYEEEK